MTTPVNNRNLAAAIANDYKIFDNLQTLTLSQKSIGRTTTASHAIDGCTSSKLTRNQCELLGNSIGLEDQYRNFSLPVVNCNSLIPRDADELSEASPSTTVWIIKSAELRTLNTRWFCLCYRKK